MPKKTVKTSVKKAAKKVAKKRPVKEEQHIKVTLVRIGETVIGKILEQFPRGFKTVMAGDFALRSEYKPELTGGCLYCHGTSSESPDTFSKKFYDEKEAIEAVAGIVACVAKFNGKRKVIAGSPLVLDAMTIG